MYILNHILFDSGIRTYWLQRTTEVAIRWRQKAAPKQNIVVPISIRNERILALIHIVNARVALTLLVFCEESRAALIFEVVHLLQALAYTILCCSQYETRDIVKEIIIIPS